MSYFEMKNIRLTSKRELRDVYSSRIRFLDM